jgi:DNA polymerase V
MSTRSFPHTIEDVAVLEGAIGHHIAHVAEKLRERHLVAGALTIVCAPSRHGAFALREGTQIIALEEPTNNTAELLRFAHKLFTQVYEPGVPYKKAGAIVSGLIPDAFVSESLFTMSATEAKKNVYDVVDMLNERFGKDTVYPGVVLGTKEWAPRTELRSQEYTTSWSQIASVKAI